MEQKRYGSDLVIGQLGQPIKVNGVKNIDGMKFHDIEGGFGKNKKAMLVKEIANIHNREEKHINEVINNNILRFTKGIDIINLLEGENFKVVVNDLGLRSSNRQKWSYLLSERGYSKLLKILDDDVAWEQYDKLVDRYFNMRAELKEKPASALELFESQLLALKEVKCEVEGVKTELQEFKEDLPLIGSEPEELQKVVKRIGTRALGGYKSPAYCDKSISTKVYKNVWKYVKDQFNVNTYKAIKRKYLSKAKELAETYEPPFYLQEEIDIRNNQGKLDV